MGGLLLKTPRMNRETNWCCPTGTPLIPPWVIEIADRMVRYGFPVKNCSKRNSKTSLTGAESGCRLCSAHQLFHARHAELYAVSVDPLHDLVSIWITPSENPSALKVFLIWAKRLRAGGPAGLGDESLPLCSTECSVFLGGELARGITAPEVLDTKPGSAKLVPPLLPLFPPC